MSVRKSLAWAFSGQFTTLLVSFAGSVVMARLLGPTEMGIYAIAVATIGVLGIFAAFGLSSYVTREANLTEAALQCAFTVNALLNIMMSLIIFGSSFAISAIVKSEGAGGLMQLLAVLPLISMFDFRPNSMLHREMQFKSLTVVSVPIVIVSTLLSIVFALNGYSFYSLAYAAIISAVLSTVATNMVGHRYVSLRLSLTGWKTIAAFGLKMMSVSGLAHVASKASTLTLGSVLGVEALGLYSRASNIADMVFFNIYGTATKVVFVKLSADYRETGILRETFLRSLELIVCIMWPILFGIAVLSGPLVFIVYGPQWQGAALPLSLLMIAQCIVLCFGMNWELFVLKDEVGRQTKLEFIRAAFGLMTFAIGSLFSISAAALGRVVEALFGFGLYYPHVQRLANVRSREVLGVYWRSGLLTIVAVGPSLILMCLTNWDATTPVVHIVGAVALGILAWLAVIHLTNHPVRTELQGLWQRVLAGTTPPSAA